MIKEWDSWNDVKADEWPSRYFTPQELACRGTGALKIKLAALAALDQARSAIGKPFIINSAYRSPLHNARIGGAPRSKHKEGHAFDISLRNHDINELRAVLSDFGFTGFGLYDTFLHADMGPRRLWGKKK